MKTELKPLIVVALVKVKTDAIASFKDAAGSILAPTRKEAGCLSYLFQQSVDDAHEFAFLEKWESEDHLQDHLKSAHMQAFFKTTSPMFQPGFPLLKRYSTLDV